MPPETEGLVIADGGRVTVLFVVRPRAPRL